MFDKVEVNVINVVFKIVARMKQREMRERLCHEFPYSATLHTGYLLAGILRGAFTPPWTFEFQYDTAFKTLRRGEYPVALLKLAEIALLFGM